MVKFSSVDHWVVYDVRYSGGFLLFLKFLWINLSTVMDGGVGLQSSSIKAT